LQSVKNLDFRGYLSEIQEYLKISIKIHNSKHFPLYRERRSENRKEIKQKKPREL
jgi:hypothetical protein